MMLTFGKLCNIIIVVVFIYLLSPLYVKSCTELLVLAAFSLNLIFEIAGFMYPVCGSSASLNIYRIFKIRFIDNSTTFNAAWVSFFSQMIVIRFFNIHVITSFQNQILLYHTFFLQKKQDQFLFLGK